MSIDKTSTRVFEVTIRDIPDEIGDANVVDWLDEVIYDVVWDKVGCVPEDISIKVKND